MLARHLGGWGSLLDQFPQLWRGQLLGRDLLSPCPWDSIYLGQRTFVTEHPESRGSPRRLSKPDKSQL